MSDKHLMNKPFNIQLSTVHQAQLNDMHELTGLSKSMLMRAALLSYHKMLVQGIPTCSNGQPCLAPMLHVQQQQQIQQAVTPPATSHLQQQGLATRAPYMAPFLEPLPIVDDRTTPQE